MNRGILALSCLVLGLTSILVFGAEAGRPVLPISVTVSGGASYGAYQAGFLYVANDWVRVNRHDTGGVRVVSVTGASAGAINALMAVFSLANTSFVRDTQSLFYRAWIKTGFDKFLPAPKSQILDALLSGSFLDTLRDLNITPELSDSISKGFPVDVILGLAATRTIASQTELTKGLSIASCEQKFVVRMTRPDSGKWMLRNYIDSASTLPAAVLHLGQEVKNNAEVLKDLVRASSAFPGFFPPETLGLCQIIPRDVKEDNVHWDAPETPSFWDEIIRVNEAHGKKPETVEFVDGGLFDRAPLKFAMDLVHQGLIEDSSGVYWAKLRSRQPDNPKIDATPFVYISQDNAVFPQPKPPNTETGNSLIGTLKSVGGSLVNSAQEKELSTLSEQYPTVDLRVDLKLTRGYAPCMSGQLQEFLGFFERPFRVFDFYLGMYDAQKYFEAVTASVAAKHPESKINKKLPSTEEDSSDIRFQVTKKVLDLVYTTVDSCRKNQAFSPDRSYWAGAIKPVNQWFDSIYDKIPYCKDSSASAKTNCRYNLAQHIILLQSSIDLLWARWISFERRKDCWEVSDTTSNAAWARMTKTCHPTFLAKGDRNRAATFPGLLRLPESDYQKQVVERVSHDPLGNPFDEKSYDALLFLLERYEFTYEDIRGGLGKAKLTARQAAFWISNDLTKVIYQYGKRVKRQKAKNPRECLGNKFGGFGYQLLSKPLANFLAYSPSPLAVRIGAGSEGIHGGLSYLFSFLRLIPQDLLAFDMDGYGNIVEDYYSLSGGLLCNFSPGISKGWFPLAVGASYGAGGIRLKPFRAQDEFGSLIAQVAFLDMLYIRLSYPFYLHDVLTGKSNWVPDHANGTRFAWQVGLQFLFF